MNVHPVCSAVATLISVTTVSGLLRKSILPFRRSFRSFDSEGTWKSRDLVCQRHPARFNGALACVQRLVQ